MKFGLAPAIALFAAVAAGLMLLRDNVTGGIVAEAAETDTLRVGIAETVEAPGGRSALLRQEDDGHYWTMAKVNGTPVRFMVDTGASVIALTERDARRIGLDLDALPRNAQVSTAAGRVQAAAAMLNEVAIERVKVSDVQAVVIEEGLEQSLLGMSFLNRMDGWDVTPKAIVIRQ